MKIEKIELSLDLTGPFDADGIDFGYQRFSFEKSLWGAKSPTILDVKWQLHLSGIHLAKPFKVTLNQESGVYNENVDFMLSDSQAFDLQADGDQAELYLILTKTLYMQGLIKPHHRLFIYSDLFPEWNRGFISDERIETGFHLFFYRRALKFLTENNLIQYQSLKDVPINLKFTPETVDENLRARILDKFFFKMNDSSFISYSHCDPPKRFNDRFIKTLPPKMQTWLDRERSKLAEQM